MKEIWCVFGMGNSVSSGNYPQPKQDELNFSCLTFLICWNDGSQRSAQAKTHSSYFIVFKILREKVHEVLMVLAILCHVLHNASDSWLELNREAFLSLILNSIECR